MMHDFFDSTGRFLLPDPPVGVYDDARQLALLLKSNFEHVVLVIGCRAAVSDTPFIYTVRAERLRRIFWSCGLLMIPVDTYWAVAERYDNWTLKK